MHAYLLVSQNSDFDSDINKLAGKIHAKIVEFPLAKIEDVRNLNGLIRLSFDKPTLIVCRDIHEAGEEALNAFLKNLEEPQENIYFALTAPSVRRVLPTIVSRCQIIRPANYQSLIIDNHEIKDFLSMTIGEKFSYIDKIKDRAKAIEFAENMVNFMHKGLHENVVKYEYEAENIRLAIKTLSGLKANGNVNLQLSNFAIKYAK
jgi:DNA polymerase III delta prime subunit